MTMKKSRFTNEQIAGSLKQAESGVPVIIEPFSTSDAPVHHIRRKSQ